MGMCGGGQGVPFSPTWGVLCTWGVLWGEGVGQRRGFAVSKFLFNPTAFGLSTLPLPPVPVKVTDVLKTQDLKMGYNDLLVIPAGATNIRVAEVMG